jgi:tetratricopeptide (TPR) repeat protein
MRALLFIASCLLMSVGASALAQAPSAQLSSTAVTTDELVRAARDLASENEQVRQNAWTLLMALEEDSLPAIAARVQTLQSHRPALTETIPTLASFRRALGSRRADDDVDMANGIPSVLRERRDANVLSMAESVLLLRTLERIGTIDAQKLLTTILSWDGDAWQQESRRIYSRMGARLLPLLINPPGNPNKVIRRWIPAAARDFHLDNPSRAVQQTDARLVSEILVAYGNIRRMDAMRVIASFLGNERVQIREAARTAIAKYGRNAIWVLRQAYENMSGHDADLNWSTERTMREVLALNDQVRLAEARTDFEAGTRAQQAGRLSEAVRHFDVVLLRAPAIAERGQMASAYAAFAVERLAARDLPAAAHNYRRAIWLAPTDPQAARWRAALTFVTAESQLAQGVADVYAYRETLAADATNEGAAHVVAQLTGEAAAKTRLYNKIAAAVAALALLVLAIHLHRRGARKPRAPRNDHDVTSPGETPAPV